MRKAFRRGTLSFRRPAQRDNAAGGRGRLAPAPSFRQWSLSKLARAAVGAIPRQDQLISGNASDSVEFFAMGAARRDYVERWPADPVARAVLPARNPFPSGTGCGGPSAKARSASGATVARR